MRKTWLLITVLFIAINCQTISNEQRCENRAKSIAALTVATESLSKASAHYTNFTYCEINSTSTEELKEKDRIMFYLESAKDIISEVQGDVKTTKCGGNIIQDTGFISSPNYPDDYPPNEDCTWILYVPKNHTIVLQFLSFEIQYYENCTEDYLEIRDGHENTSAVLETFCGYSIPEYIRSTNNTMTVKFISNGSVQKAGFVAHFIKDLDECIGSHGCQHNCINTPGSYKCECRNGFQLNADRRTCNESCTYHITNSNVYITSPNFPGDYPSNSKCSWLFTTAPGHQIKLTFQVFSLESEDKCYYDNIVAFNGKDNNSPVMAKYCGSGIPQPILSSQNNLYMLFKSDKSVNREGFKAFHTTVCGGEILAQRVPEKLDSHVEFGNGTYGNKERCNWIIQGVNQSRIRLRFVSFHLEQEAGCNYDFVKIYDGRSSSKKFVGKYCGLNGPPEIISITSSLSIEFSTDHSTTFNGFSAKYTTFP